MRAIPTVLLTTVLTAGATGCGLFWGAGDDNSDPSNVNAGTNMGVNTGTNTNGGTNGSTDGYDFPGPPNFTLDCEGGGQDLGADVYEAWQDEAEGQAPVGYAATFDLDGTPYHLSGEGRSDVEAPFRIVSPYGGGGGQFLFFPDAATSQGAGFLVLEMASADDSFEVTVDGGSMTGVQMTEVTVEPEMVVEPVALPERPPAPTLPDEWSAAASDYDYAVSIGGGVDQMSVAGHSGGVIVPEEGEPVEVSTGESVLVESASDVLVVESTRIEAADPNIEAVFDRFALAGEFEAGTVDVEGLDPRVPTTVVGVDGALAFAAEGPSTSSEIRMTQAINDGGLLIPAEVEIAPGSTEVEVARTKKKRVEFFYRESTFLGDAVLGEITIEPESAADMVELSVSSGLMIERLIDWVKDAGYAWPVAAVGAAIAAPFVIIADVVSCIFGDCPDAPDPFPNWMAAGDVGSFEIEFSGKLPTGTHDVTLTFVGKNYCPVSVTVTVVVT